MDFAVGFSQIKKVGETVAAGEPLLMMHARNEETLAFVLPLLEKRDRDFAIMNWRNRWLRFLCARLRRRRLAREPVASPSDSSVGRRDVYPVAAAGKGATAASCRSAM